jgi:starch-binding outer membrane protein, SusD/RagB family
MPQLTNAFVTENGLDMRTEIRRERTVELAFEMFRYDDLRRWKTAETELPKPVRGIKVVGSEWSTLPGWAEGTHPVDEEGFVIAERAANRTFEVAKHYWQPLPSKQISLYPDILTQNPGWQ